MSVDNVMAVAAAAKGQAGLMAFGLIVSIPTVVVGAQVIMRLMERYPLLVIVGGGLLGYIAGDMAVDDPVIENWTMAHAGIASIAVPLLGVALVVGAGMWLSRRRHAEGA